MKFNKIHHTLIFIAGSLLPQFDTVHAAFGTIPPTTTIFPTTSRAHASSLSMIGRGPGWGNDDFLNSLGGNDNEQNDSEEKYQEYKKTREAFDQRQLERMQSPAAQKFMAEMQKKQQQRAENTPEGDYSSTDDGMIMDKYSEIGSTSGGSRLRNMMRKSDRMNPRHGSSQPPSIMSPEGFEQKFIVPPEELEDENDKKDDDLTWSF